MKTNIPFLRNSIFIAGMQVFTPPLAYAHGDFVLVYGLFAIAFFHIVGLLIIVISKYFKGHRTPILLVYASSTFVTWLWAINFRGPDYYLWVGLIGVPILIMLSLVWVARGKKGS
ncbi:MAG: hypothetical protein MUP98_19125 [Candidatus Aminicenantes bacterium]|nr:hypothetical protein [Candidatus Aminicenantes bacterium]